MLTLTEELNWDDGTVPVSEPLSSTPFTYVLIVRAAASYTPATWYHRLRVRGVADARCALVDEFGETISGRVKCAQRDDAYTEHQSQ